MRHVFGEELRVVALQGAQGLLEAAGATKLRLQGAAESEQDGQPAGRKFGGEGHNLGLGSAYGGNGFGGMFVGEAGG